MKIVIMESSVMLREFIVQACTKQRPHEVVGITDCGKTALGMVRELKPDLVIIALTLKDRDGLAVVEEILWERPAPRVLIASVKLDAVTVFRVEMLKVHGFFDKKTGTVADFCAALDDLALGRRYFSPSFITAKAARHANPESFEKILSPAEQRVLALVGEGLSDQEIGDRLGITAATAQKHRSRLLKKLHITGSPKLVAYALRHGFTRAEADGKPSAQ